MVSILVTGSRGQLGSAIQERAGAFEQYAFSFIDIKELDLTNEKQVRDYFRLNQFDYIINCAAYTAVDQAEKFPKEAFALNAAFPSLLGSLCISNACRLIHISTDYVYNGNNHLPHLEDEDLLPLSVYAQTKLDGEKALWQNDKAIIIRTSWLYSEYGNNFMKTMIRRSREQDELKVVYDQTGTPTYAGDLADTILNIIGYSEVQCFKAGIYNYSNEGVCSWFDFAMEIMHLTGSSCRIKPIRSEAYPLPAKRPDYSVLDKQKIKNNFGLKIPYWRDSLASAFNKLVKNGEI